MKFAHISDLHLGKRLYEVSLLEDQVYILEEIRAALREEAPDAVLIAGDVYDKSAPSAEAVRLFDDFLSGLVADGQKTFVISGNHDSAARVAYGGRIMQRSGVYLSAPAYDGDVRPVTLTDAHGPVDIFLLPFIKPTHVALAFPDEKVESYTDALRVAVGHLPMEEKRRSVLVAHQFVTGAMRSDSEPRNEADLSAAYELLIKFYANIKAWDKGLELSKKLMYAGDAAAVSALFARGDILSARASETNSQDDRRDAFNAYAQISLLFPKSSRTAEATFRAYQTLTVLNDARAKIFADKLKKDYPKSDYAKQL